MTFGGGYCKRESLHIVDFQLEVGISGNIVVTLLPSFIEEIT